MAAVMQISYENFQDEFEKVKESLKDVDENIKKLTGRDPKLQRKRRGNENIASSNIKERGRDHSNVSSVKRERRGAEDERITSNKRTGSALARLGSREERQRRERRNSEEDEEISNRPSIQSSVVSTPNKVQIKTRRDSLIELKSDKKVMARNRRMFGLLIGTLQKFQNEQSQQKDKEQKRHEIEEKLEQAAVKEKEELQKERWDLFLSRRKQQALLRRLEQKMEIAKMHEEWEKQQRCLLGFIKTKTSPQIMYVPAKSTAVSEKRLQESSAVILDEIAQRRKKMEEDIKELDETEQEVSSIDNNGKLEMTDSKEDEGNSNTVALSESVEHKNFTNEGTYDDGDFVMASVHNSEIVEDQLNNQELTTSAEPEFEPVYD